MESAGRHFQKVKSFLSWASICLFLAFAWEYWRRGGPFRNIFWDEDLMSSVVVSLGWSWSEWVTSPAVEGWMKLASQGTSIVFFISAILSFIYFYKNKKILEWGILIGVLFLFFQVLLKSKAHFWQIGQIMELTLQWGSPVIFIIACKDNISRSSLALIIRIAIAITFVGHALYAIGYYPIPGHFLSMMMDGLGLENDTATTSLFIIGCLDIIASFLLFIPNEKIKKGALIYIILWGFLTAVARLWSYYSFYSIGMLADLWLPQSMLRWVHFLVPISLWYLEKTKQASALSV